MRELKKRVGLTEMKSGKGFTLIETMVAITILTLAVAGPMFTASRAIVAARAASGQLTASYLAQEGVEYVRMLRDNSYLLAYQANPDTATTTGWANFRVSVASCKTLTIGSPPFCTFDPAERNQPQLSSSLYCSGASCNPLYILLMNGVGVYYTQQPGPNKTPFTRTIQVQEIDIPGVEAEERVISTVTWWFHTVKYTVTTIDHLTPYGN